MNELQKESNLNPPSTTQPSKLSTLAQLDDPHRQKPTLLRINADNQDKTFMCLFWSVFLVFVIVLAITSKLLPKAIKPIDNNTELAGTTLEGCQNPSVFQNSLLQCGSFSPASPLVGLVTRKLSSLNQFLTFWLQLYPSDLTQPLIIDQNLTYLLYGLEATDNGLAKTDLFQNETVRFEYTSQSTNYIYADNGKTIVGYKVFLGFIGQFQSTNLLLSLQFSGPFEQFTSLSTIRLTAFKIAKSFTVFTIVLRYVFFVLSILAAFLYNRNYRKIPITDRIIQQKLIEILSVFLIFFNDPFYPITVLKENMASSFFSMLFVLSFVVYLIFMWVVFFDRILYEQGQKETQQITKFKIAYAVILFALLMTLYMLYANYRLNNHPLVPREKIGEKSILILDALATVCFVAVIIYILFQYLRICCDKTDRLWRNDLMMFYSILFIVAMIVFVFTDNALGSYSYNGTTFIFLYGLMNLYTWYLQYMYSPAKETAQQAMEKRSLHSDELMSVGTVEFNDLNINLDENEEFRGLNAGYKVERANNQRQDNQEWGRDIIGKQHIYQAEQKEFSIQDEDSGLGRVPDRAGEFNKVAKNSQKQQIDFFDQQKINQFIEKQAATKIHQTKQANETNLLHLSSNQTQIAHHNHHLHPEFIAYQAHSEELDQNELEVLSETVSQRPEQQQLQEPHHDIQIEQKIENQKKDKRQEEGFGSFQLD